MDNPTTLRKVGLAVFKDGKIMMVRDNENDTVYYQVGGGVEQGEDDIATLIREVKEEIGCDLNLESIKFLGEFEDWAHGRENTKVNIRLYEADLIGEPKPSMEIVDIAWFDSTVDRKHLSAIGRNLIFPWLKEHGLIL